MKGIDIMKPTVENPYKYIVFKDAIGELFVIRDILLKDCMFSGSFKDLKILEQGIFNKENKKDFSYIGALINKRKEWENKIN